MPNNPRATDNLKPFQKGDKRINRRGRPKSFDALRALAQQIAHEPAASDETVTTIENMLRDWAKGDNPQLQQAFVAYAYGKVPDKQEITGAEGQQIDIGIKIVDYRTDIASPEK
jgi:hypothetical protein